MTTGSKKTKIKKPNCGGVRKVTDGQIMYAIEVMSPGDKYQDVAKKLGIAKSTLSERMGKLNAKINQYASELLQTRAIQLVNDLLHQSNSGKAEATKTALEILGMYRNKVEHSGNFAIEGYKREVKQKVDALIRSTFYKN